MAAFNFTYDASVTTTMRAWIEDVLGRCRFPVGRGQANITVKVLPEPSCPGHQDYMCTAWDGMAAHIEIRAGVDNPAHPANAGLPNPLTQTKTFFQECFIHELGHVFFFAHYNADDRKTQMSGWFRHTGATGSGAGRQGLLADWNPLTAAWEDRTQEAVAEFFKDVYLIEADRVYENRTNWEMQAESFPEFVAMIESITCHTPAITSMG